MHNSNTWFERSNLLVPFYIKIKAVKVATVVGLQLLQNEQLDISQLQAKNVIDFFCLSRQSSQCGLKETIQ